MKFLGQKVRKKNSPNQDVDLETRNACFYMFSIYVKSVTSVFLYAPRFLLLPLQVRTLLHLHLPDTFELLVRINKLPGSSNIVPS